MSGTNVPDTYCAAAFDHIYSDNRGRYRLCCHAAPIKALGAFLSTNTVPFDYFLSEEMDDIRQRMLTGEPIHACQSCYDIESDGGRSPRLTDHHSDQSFHRDVRDVELKLRVFGSYCNLGCYMCFPHNSSTRRAELKSAALEEFWDDDSLAGTSVDRVQYEKIVSNILANIGKVSHIKLTGGEPLLLPKHYEFLEQIPDSDAARITLSYDTNLTALHFKNWSFEEHVVPRFRSVRLAVSCDHYGDRLAWIRFPVDIETFEANLVRARRWIRQLHCTVSILNVHDLAEIGSYYQERFGIATSFCSVVSRPKMLSICNLPDKESLLKTLEQNPQIDAKVLTELRRPACEADYRVGLDYVRRLDEHRRDRVVRASLLWPWIEDA